MDLITKPRADAVAKESVHSSVAGSGEGIRGGSTRMSALLKGRGWLGQLQWIGNLFRLKSIQPTFIPAIGVAEAPVVG